MLQITGGSKKQPMRAASTMSDENDVPGGKVAEVLSGSGGVGVWRACTGGNLLLVDQKIIPFDRRIIGMQI